jgi:prolipoprotein diacylglyceryltransferase
MNSDKQALEPEKKFEPLQIMGIFWLVFGIIVLASSFFVEPTPQVPLVRGIVTNIIAGVLLLGAGVLCIVKARIKKKASSLEPRA